MPSAQAFATEGWGHADNQFEAIFENLIPFRRRLRFYR